MTKKMYVIQAEDGMFFCGMRYWDKQLRKAKIYHSLHYAKDVVDAYEGCNCKIVEVSLAIAPEVQTNADRIRAMSDEELAVFLVSVENRRRGNGCGAVWHLPDIALEWLQQPAEEDTP